MKRGRSLSRLAQFLEIPPEVLMNVPRIEVIGHLQFRVENYRGLISYSPSQIVLALADGRLFVKGEGLVIGWLDRHEVLVTGQVHAVQFTGGHHG